MSSFDVRVHPLAVANVTAHCTRARSAAGDSFLRSQVEGAAAAVGALVGAIDGRRVDIYTSFEVKINRNETLDGDFFQQRLAQFAEVHSGWELAGWYVVELEGRRQPGAFEARLSPAAEALNEQPLVLTFDGAAAAAALGGGRRTEIERLVVVYETASGDEGRFRQLPFQLGSSDDERIAVDFVAKAEPTSADAVGSISVYLSTLTATLEVMQQRLAIVREYLEDIRDGKCHRNAALLRELHALTASIERDAQSSFVEGRESMRRQLSVGLAPALLSGSTQLLADFSAGVDLFSASRSFLM
eukprot:Polyplicarium_translucidae@DN3465_c0_g1_i1.p1